MRRPLAPTSEHIPNLAPMVDVIMVILVFFLLGASLELSREGVLQTELDPRSGPGEGATIEIIPLVKIALEATGAEDDCNVYVLGERLAPDGFERLARLLIARRSAGADPTSPVVIAAQPDVRWRFVVRAMDAAVKAGFSNVQFAVGLEGRSE